MTLASIIAANRFGLGARPGELAAIGGDPRGWLLKQLSGVRPLPQEMAALPSSAKVFQTSVQVLQQRRQQKRAAEDNSMDKVGGDAGRRHKVQPLDVGAQALGSALAERTRTAIARAESGAQGMALAARTTARQRAHSWWVALLPAAESLQTGPASPPAIYISSEI